MSDFRIFEEQFGAGFDEVKVPDNTIVKHKDLLPKELILFWQEKGFRGYSDGLFWLTNPDQFDDVITEWFGESEEIPCVIARTAFADLFIWMDQGIHYLNVQYGKILEMRVDMVEFFNTTLCDPEIQEEFLKKSLFEEAGGSFTDT